MPNVTILYQGVHGKPGLPQQKAGIQISIDIGLGEAAPETIFVQRTDFT